MAYICKIAVPASWTSVETLIKTIDADFAFAEGKQYSLQADSKYGIRICNTSSLPTDDEAGEHLADYQVAYFEPEDGATLYVKLRSPGYAAALAVSELS